MIEKLSSTHLQTFDVVYADELPSQQAVPVAGLADALVAADRIHTLLGGFVAVVRADGALVDVPADASLVPDVPGWADTLVAAAGVLMVTSN
jgi:hypothetical protein